MRLLFLFIATILFARENPFVPIVTNENNNLIKKQYFKEIRLNLPSDARIMKSITIKYQSLSGAIKQSEFPINKEVDWHNTLILKSLSKQSIQRKIKMRFLDFYIKNHKVLIQTNYKIIRNFSLISPYRYVIDFKANKSFLNYTKQTNLFIKKIALGNHSSFFRVVLYLDGIYKPILKKVDEGYLIEFK